MHGEPQWLGRAQLSTSIGRDEVQTPPTAYLRAALAGQRDADPGMRVLASIVVQCLGISFNQRTTMNLGYAHSWSLGTTTRTRLLEPTPAWPGSRETQSRDLQIGRLLFGVTYRLSDRASINWSVEAGLTEDAPDLRTVLRIPITLITGS